MYHECMSYVALQAITNQSLNMILANEGTQTRPYQYFVTVGLSVPPTMGFERPQSSQFSGLFV